MLTLGQPLIGKDVLSLRTGGVIGGVQEAIIDPNNLKIEGWHATNGQKRSHAILLSQDIRDILSRGFVVNDHEALSDPDELVRLKRVLDYKFELIGKSVYTTGKKRLGKVSDYAFEKNGFFIQKIYVSQSLIKSFGGGMLTIDRTQIVEINTKRIVVKEATVKDGSPVPVAA